MSWPRKNEVGRIYRDKNKKSYLIVFVDEESRWPDGCWDAIANVLHGDEPSLGTCGVNPNYVSMNRLKRVAWNELPSEWQRAFREWLVNLPRSIRGFWRHGEQPEKRRQVRHATT